MPLFGKRHVEARLTSVAWNRTVQLEEQEWVARRSGWVPSGDVRNVEKHTERHWETVTDMRPGPPGANGIPGPPTPVTRQEMRTKVYYTFEALEWHKGRSFEATGTDTGDVHWPQYTATARERVRETKETYSATFASPDKQYDVELPEPQWRTMETGGAYQLTRGLFGGVKKVAPSPA